MQLGSVQVSYKRVWGGGGLKEMLILLIWLDGGSKDKMLIMLM